MSQASHEFRGSVDFNQFELRNPILQNLLTPPIGPRQGQIYFNSTLDLKSPFYWDSTEWVPFGLKPVHKRYVDETSMLAGQALQIKYYIYYRSDLDIYYEYLGTTTGIFEDDYNPIGGNGIIPEIIGTPNFLTKYNSPNGITESQIFDNGINVGVGTIDFTDPARIVISGRVSQIGLGTSSYFGFEAGLNQVVGDRGNTGFGYRVLKALTTGVNNTGIGYLALASITTGFQNMALGSLALVNATTGRDNVAIGNNSLVAVTSGGFNIGIGAASLATITTAINNTAIGFASLLSATGSNNTTIGFQSGLGITTGIQNTFLGSRSVEDLTTGSNNIAIGYFVTKGRNSFSDSIFIGNSSIPLANGQTNQIIIGHSLTGNGSNTVTIGNSSIVKNYLNGTVKHAPAVLGEESVILDQLNAAIGGVPIVTAGAGLTKTGNVFSLGDLNLTWTPGTGLIYGGDWESNFTPRTLVTQQYLTSEIIASAYVHPTFTPFSINTSAAQIIDELTTTSEGHVSGITLRNLTLADLGYTGAPDANNYIHPAYTPQNPTLTGALVLASLVTDSIGSVVSTTTRNLTTANINAINIDQLGVANGVATLDSSGQLTSSQIPDSLLGGLVWKGRYNGTVISDSPDAPLNGTALPTPSSVNNGWFFISIGSYTVSGTDYNDGDWIISNGIDWIKIDNTDQVTSVFGRLGAITALAADYASFYVRHDVDTQGLSGTNQGNARTNINAEQTIIGGATTITQADLTPNRALVSSSGGKVDVSITTRIELSYLSGATSNIQTQLNGKLSGNEIITLSGDVTGSGATAIATTISNDAVTTTKILNSNVTYAKIQNVSANRILGQTAVTGIVKELTAAEVRAIINVADGANNYVHPAKTWVDKTTLSGATVISNLTIDSLGHPTNWSTRDLTPADIGAQVAGSYVTLNTVQTITAAKTIDVASGNGFYQFDDSYFLLGAYDVSSDKAEINGTPGFLDIVINSNSQINLRTGSIDIYSPQVLLGNIGTVTSEDEFLAYHATEGIKKITAANLLTSIGGQPAGSYVTGTGVSGQVTYFNGVNSITSSSKFLYNDTTANPYITETGLLSVPAISASKYDAPVGALYRLPTSSNTNQTSYKKYGMIGAAVFTGSANKWIKVIDMTFTGAFKHIKGTIKSNGIRNAHSQGNPFTIYYHFGIESGGVTSSARISIKHEFSGLTSMVRDAKVILRTESPHTFEVWVQLTQNSEGFPVEYEWYSNTVAHTINEIRTTVGGDLTDITAGYLQEWSHLTSTIKDHSFGLLVATNGVTTSLLPTESIHTQGRIRAELIDNLGVSASDVLVPSATGVFSKRTLTEFKSDLGLSTAITGTGVAGQVAFFNGTGSIAGDSGFVYDSPTDVLTLRKDVQSNISIPLKLINRGEGGGESVGIVLSAQNFQVNTQIISSREGANTFESLLFYTGGNNVSTEKWRILSSGVLRSNGAQTIQTSSGVLTLQGNGGNILVGTTTSAGSVSPLNFSLGGTFGTNAPGNINNIKLSVFDNGTNKYGFGISSNLFEIIAGTNGAIGFFVNSGVEAWRMLPTGVLQSNGAQTITASTGNLTLATAAGNGHIQFLPNGSGRVSAGLNLIDTASMLTVSRNVSANTVKAITLVNANTGNNTGISIKFTVSSDPLSTIGSEIKSVRTNTDSTGSSDLIFATSNGSTLNNYLVLKHNGNILIGTTTDSGDKLRVNGTVRVDSVTNATGDSVTIDANNVLRRRTAAETLTDIGGIGGTGTTNELAYFTAASTIASLTTATYPSLTELSYVKGVTSSLQTQIDSKQVTITGTKTEGYIPKIVSGVETWVAPPLMYKLLEEDITPTGFTSTTFSTILSGSLLGTNSFDGAVDASYDGLIYIRSNNNASYNYDIRFTMWGQDIDTLVNIGSITGDLTHIIKFKLIIQGGEFLITGVNSFVDTSINFVYGQNINGSMTKYTASGSSSLAIHAKVSGTGSPTLYLTSFVLKQTL